jgi:predicted transcriptional regulator
LSATVPKIHGITLQMSKSRCIRLRLDADKIDALDAIASSSNRDRGSLLNESVANYLDLQAHHTSLIKQGLLALQQQSVISTGELRTRIARRAQAQRTKPKK